MKIRPLHDRILAIGRLCRRRLCLARGRGACPGL